MKQSRTEGPMLPDLKINDKLTLMKTVYCWHENGHVGKNGTEYRIQKLTHIYMNQF